MFQNNERKFYQQLGGKWAKRNQQPDAKEVKRFWSKRERKDYNKKAEWINNIETESRMLEEGPKVKIHPDTLKATLKKLKTRKHLA